MTTKTLQIVADDLAAFCAGLSLDPDTLRGATSLRLRLFDEHRELFHLLYGLSPDDFLTVLEMASKRLKTLDPIIGQLGQGDSQ